VQAVTLTQVTSFGTNPGNLKMWKYVPAGLASGSPLVVAMHGCTESASVYSTQTEWGNLADRFQFSVVFPEQQTSNNSSSCFNWFQLGDISRGQGEALSIKQMVDTMKSSHGSDPARIFVTGMSAGGFMTEVMMAAYPDVFAGGAVNSGGPYQCATSLTGASPCQLGNVSHTPAQWGDLVRGAFPGYTGPYPRLVAFHGSTDATVAPADLQQSVDQWSNVLGIDETADVNETFRTATHKVFRDAGGRSMIETYLVSGMGHALTVDPGTNVDQGGATGAFCEDHDIYSSYYAAVFWGLTGGGGSGDTTAPTVSVTSPASGATVSGTIAVTANASDNVGVTRVDVLVDGTVKGSDTTAPYAVSVDTTTLSNGSHTISARAFDAANNVGSSSAVTVTVQNSGGTTSLLETFSSASGPDNPGWTLGGWTLSTKDATGTAGSRSITASAAPRFNTVTQTATWAGLLLGAAPRLSYARQLALSDANTTASSGLSIIVNDGTDHIVDAKSISGFTSYSEPSFTTRSNIDLSAFAGKTVTLKFVLTASDTSSTVTSASAVIDQIQIQ
ncbi:MAG TPA: PHB depolymerase family esterase, partial [Candidatus Limnocylindrales bacterium]|jgi:poly(hydroxyalkanoate) depolymerase family esterase|nr:PHB depolymerase family esterase [Candidatus Limnocylindrales bacterium]